jgi:predicted  nucleic acid-binding Zn-ribbon protein
MSQVLEILTLQSLDDEVASLTAALAEVDRRLLGDEGLDAARERLAAASQALVDEQRRQRSAEADVAGLSARIAPEEKRLYDGSVKNPKELGSIQHEIELLKAARSKVEDHLLEVLSRLEVLEPELREARDAVAALEERWATMSEELARDAERLKRAIAASDSKREAQKGRLPARFLLLYEDIRRRKGGMAVARIQGSACSGCRITVPDAVRKRAFGTETIAQCPNCDRILCVG